MGKIKNVKQRLFDHRQVGYSEFVWDLEFDIWSLIY
jgi:hypothetical protein